MNTQKKALFQRDFTLVVIGQIISLFGNAILRFALPLYLLRKTGSSTLFGMVNACSFVPMILFSLIGGVLADRLPKKNIMVVLDFVTAGIVILFYLMHGMVPIVPLMIICLMLLYGISGTYQPAVQASIPALVPQEAIMQGNAVINMVSTLSGLLGPVLGGILFGAWGITPILLISISCFLCSAVMEIFIRIPFEKREQKNGILAIVKEDWKESWQFIRREKPVFLSTMLILALFNLVLSSAVIIGIPVLVINILGMSDAHLGITQGALGLGGLVGGLLGGILGKRLKLRHGYFILGGCSLTVAFMGCAMLPIFSPFAGYLLITIMSFLAMVVSTLFTIQLCSAVQQQTPSHFIGKIMAFILAGANCASPIGQAVYGVLFSVGSKVPWLVLFVAAAFAMLIAMYSKKVFLTLENG